MRSPSFPLLLILLGFPSLCPSQELVTTKPELAQHSLGIGLGVPYGILGLNLDINLVPNLNASAGLGTTLRAGVGYSAGFKLFLTPIDNIFRPRLSAFYGINTIVVYEGNENLNQAYRGFSLGLGAQLLWQKTKNGFDFDVYYIATSEADINNLRRAAICLGFRRAF